MGTVAGEGAACNKVDRYRELRKADRLRVELEGLVPPESLIRLVDLQEVRRRHRAPRARSRIGDLFWWSVLREPCPARPARPRMPEELPDFLVTIRLGLNWLLTRACYDVWGALHDGDGEAVDLFLHDLLGLRPEDSVHRERLRVALWEVVRSGRWAHVTRRRLPYLRWAVRRAAARLDDVRRDRPREARRAARPSAEVGADEPVVALEAIEDLPDPSGGPVAWIEAAEAIRKRCRRHPLHAVGCGVAPEAFLPGLRGILDELRRAALPRDQARLLDLLDNGYTPAEAVATVGRGWVPYQALEDKITRRLTRRGIQ